MVRKIDSATKRLNDIIAILEVRDYVRVSEFVERLAVSEATIRKDLTTLEAQGLLRRTHGGAIHRRELTHEIAQFYEYREVQNLAEKRRIGVAASRLIQPGQVIAFSGGSTTLQIAHHVADDMAFTAITNDLAILQALARHTLIDIFVPGGYLRMNRNNLIGPNAIAAVQGIAIDCLFLTVTGLDLETGATAGHISHVVYLRELVERAALCVVVADHSKFQNPPQVVICGWDAIDMLITDTAAPDAMTDALQAYGVTVQRV